MASIQLIRSATLKIFYNNKTILVDPMLGEKGSFESYGGISKNPITALPFSTDKVLEGIDAVFVSHLHKDHFDDIAKKRIDTSIPVFCQPTNAKSIKEAGFTNVTEIASKETFNEITIHRANGKHGRGEIEKFMGQVSGFVLQAKNEPTIYIVGDSIFKEDVKKAIDTYQPDIIITNSGGAFIPGYEENLILMDAQETIDLALYAKHSKIIAVHLESLDHCTVNRANLQRAVLQSKIKNKDFYIPLDGETLEFTT